MVEIKGERDFSEWKSMVTDIIMGNPNNLQGVQKSNQLNKMMKLTGKCVKSRFKVSNAGETQRK